MTAPPNLGREWTSDFVALFSKEDDENTDKAMALKAGNLPSSIFRYRAPSERSLQSLLDGTECLVPPEMFNDPLDSALSIAEDYNDRAINSIGRKQYVRDLDLGGFKLNEEERVRLLAAEDLAGEVAKMAIEREPHNAEMHRRFAEVSKEMGRKFAREQGDLLSATFRSKLRAASFSATGRSIVMWAHYAETHRGFCIEYSLDELSDEAPQRRYLYPVIYRSTRFDASSHLLSMQGGNSDGRHMAILASLHKSQEWSYEKEWRLVENRASDKPVFPIIMPDPVAIYLGYAMTEETRDKVLTIAKVRNIPVFPMTLSDGSFELVPAED